MQGKENTGECMTFTELSRALYPEECGYRSNTGGMRIYLIYIYTYIKDVIYINVFT